MTTIYLVTVNGKVSQLAYKSLSEAQEFIANRCKPVDLENQQAYYNVLSTQDYSWYRIEDVKVEG